MAFTFFRKRLVAQDLRRYWVQFVDKQGSPYTLQNVHNFFSQEAQENRLTYGIAYDYKDLPLSENYVYQLDQLPAVNIKGHSRWFNSVVIECDSMTFINQVEVLPFVVQSERVKSYSIDLPKESSKEDFIFKYEDDDYGPSFIQVAMINAHLLHQQGWEGQGVDVAVLDRGFDDVDNDAIFETLRNDERIKATYSFVKNQENVSGGTHGSFVLSTMAGFMPDSLIGTAPQSNYCLFQTEEGSAENVVEEDYWVFAAERADSLGVDIINSSLGYSEFDLAESNHTYADMDGNTTRISIAADIAVSKGIIVVTSAGNSGNNPWHFITAPADADSVLAVGAVDAAGVHAFFSSFGPSSDGDVKPNVAAMGLNSVFADLDHGIRTGNGTSFSSPILAGGIACLRQAHPVRTPMEIVRAVEASAHIYNTPNDSLGHGIPDLWIAHEILQLQDDAEVSWNNSLYPTPSTSEPTIEMVPFADGLLLVNIYDAKGALVFEHTQSVIKGKRMLINPKFNPAVGTYIVALNLNSEHHQIKFVIGE